MAILLEASVVETIADNAETFGISFSRQANGICWNCNNPAVLYKSNWKTEQFLLGEDTCSYCVSILLDRFLNSFAFEICSDDEGIILQGARALIGRLAKEETKGQDLCNACYRVFIHADEYYGYALSLDIELSERMVHTKCADTAWTCHECTRRYFNSTYNARVATFQGLTYSTLPPNMSAWDLAGDLHCQPCWESVSNKFNIMFCDSCERYEYEENCHRYNGDVYCDPCYDEYIYFCDNCNENYHRNREHDCYYDEDDDDDNSPIHSYSYKPAPEFFGQGKYYLGFELEVESINGSRFDGASIAESTLGHHAYMKDDGSLNDGFEIVTHPHTLEEYKNLRWEFLNKLKTQGYRSWNTHTCGLHVHVSRTAFDPVRILNTRRERVLSRQAHELRFMKLIYDNQRQVERIAGRSNCHFSSFDDKNNLVPKVKHGYQSNGRYAAVNTENRETLEVRVFRGSLRLERVRSALEFVHAAVEYTRDLKVTGKNNALTWSKFLAFVVANEETYPNLLTIINETLARESANDNSND